MADGVRYVFAEATMRGILGKTTHPALRAPLQGGDCPISPPWRGAQRAGWVYSWRSG
jgi:hypothetical protein